MEILVQKVMLNQEVQIQLVINVLIHIIEIKEIVDLVQTTCATNYFFDRIEGVDGRKCGKIIFNYIIIF